jgi:drug/metabolite transporter (DMT)-like permease
MSAIPIQAAAPARLKKPGNAELGPAPSVSPTRNKTLLLGLVVGLLAASIGALYTVFARWGIAHGLQSPDLTVLRFGVAGVVMLPVLWVAWRRDAKFLLAQWKVWLAISLLAGTPFGLLMFGALQFAPSSHAAVFPFTAMSIMGMLMGAWALGEALTARRLVGISIVLAGLVILSGLEASSFTAKAVIGDLMFLLAGTLWAGFGIVLRKNRLDPLLATAVVSLSALLTYVPAYFIWNGPQRLLQASLQVLWIEILVQGVVAGSGTLFTYAKMVSLLGPGRAAMFPALAPGLAALLAWPVLGHIPTPIETLGVIIVIAGLLVAVTAAVKK